MNKQFSTMIGGALIIVFLAYFVVTTRTEVEKTNNNFKTLSLQNIKQSENIANNGKQVTLLLNKISELQQQNMLLASTDTTIKPDKKTDNSKLTSELSKISTDLNTLKKQIVDVQNTQANANLLTPTENKVSTLVENPQTFIQKREETMKAEIESMESTYEAALYTGENDINWTRDMEKKIDNLITTKKIGNGVQLQEVECHANLCKVYLSHSDQESLNEDALMGSFGNASTYLNYRNGNSSSAAQGQKEYVMYITKEGESLPSIKKN